MLQPRDGEMAAVSEAVEGGATVPLNTGARRISFEGAHAPRSQSCRRSTRRR